MSNIIRYRDVLAPTFIPPTLLYREKKYKEINYYLQNLLKKQSSPHLLIMGPTGSGKTVTIQKCILPLKTRSDIVIGYTAAAVSGYRALLAIGSELGIKEIKFGLSFESILKAFKDFVGERKAVIVLDEIDKLIENEGSDLLYFLSRDSRFTVVGITNKVYTEEMIEDPRVRSSFVPRKILFPQYTASQLHAILNARAADALYPNVLMPGVLSKISALAAKRNGDARYALELLAFACEQAEINDEKKVTEQHVDAAKDEIEDAFLRKSLEMLRESQKVLLYCIATSGDSVPTKVYSMYNQIATTTEICEKLSERRLYDFMRELNLYGFINIDKKGRGRGKGLFSKVTISPYVDKELLTEVLKNSLSGINPKKVRTLDSFVEPEGGQTSG